MVAEALTIIESHYKKTHIKSNNVFSGTLSDADTKLSYHTASIKTNHMKNQFEKKLYIQIKFRGLANHNLYGSKRAWM